MRIYIYGGHTFYLSLRSFLKAYMILILLFSYVSLYVDLSNKALTEQKKKKDFQGLLSLLKGNVYLYYFHSEKWVGFKKKNPTLLPESRFKFMTGSLNLFAKNHPNLQLATNISGTLWVHESWASSTKNVLGRRWPCWETFSFLGQLQLQRSLEKCKCQGLLAKTC